MKPNLPSNSCPITGIGFFCSLAALMSATTIIGPPLMTNTFAFFTGKSAPFYFPGSAFLLGAIFMIASAAVAYYVLHVKPIRAKL